MHEMSAGRGELVPSSRFLALTCMLPVVSHRKRLVYCLQGCKQELRLDKRELHHQRQCPLRYVPCPQGCGNSIREAEKEVRKISLQESTGPQEGCLLIGADYNAACMLVSQEHMEKDCVRRPLTS